MNIVPDAPTKTKYQPRVGDWVAWRHPADGNTYIGETIGLRGRKFLVEFHREGKSPIHFKLWSNEITFVAKENPEGQ